MNCVDIFVIFVFDLEIFIFLSFIFRNYIIIHLKALSLSKLSKLCQSPLNGGDICNRSWADTH